MNWEDEGFLLSKSNFDENSIILEAFTADHGKCRGIVYGGSSRKQKRIIQIGNKFFFNWKAKNEHKIGYFNIELIKPISPQFFEDKRKTTSILSSVTILNSLLPEGQVNKKIYLLYEDFLNKLNSENWIENYVSWELSLVKELGFGNYDSKITNFGIKQALNFSKSLLNDNLFAPNRIQLPLSRHILEKYYN